MTDKTRAIQKADKAFSLYIRARDPWCVTCKEKGVQTPTQDCSHVFPRWHQATRWDENNAYGQCRGCHAFHHRQSEADMIDHARKTVGEEKYMDMKARWKQESHFKAYQLEEIARYYTEKRKVLTNGDGSV